MRKIVLLLVVVMAYSCGTSKKPLYSWYDYSNTSYKYLKKNDEKSKNELIDSYKRIISEQKGSREVPPPGIYADYGFLLIQNNDVEEGKRMLQKEIELYPESKVFVEKILNIIGK